MEIENKIFKGLTDFHGHMGPYLVVGWKMGEIANRELGEDPFKMEALVKTGIGPPLSCIVDGIQFSTGCTLGKGNIKIQDEERPEATFFKEGKSLTVNLKDEVWREIKDASEGDLEHISKDILGKKEIDLFKVRVSDESG